MSLFLNRTQVITYNETSVEVINPYENQGITVAADQWPCDCNGDFQIANIEYCIFGTTSDGSLAIASDEPIIMTLSNLTLTRQSETLVNFNNVTTTVQIVGTNSLSDTENGKSATLLSAGDLIFTGTGRLTISGYKKHTISSDKTITIESGSIIIPQIASDGFHSEGFVMNGGFLDIISQDEGDQELLQINNGIIQINSNSADIKGIKADNVLSINGGSIDMTIAGDQSKGLSSKSDIVFSGGSINIVTSGATVLEAAGSGYDPSYCSAVKCDGYLIVNNGNINIENISTNDGGKDLSADGNIRNDKYQNHRNQKYLY